MILLDVNVLVYAHRSDRPEHARIRGWLEGVLNGDSAFGVADLVLSGFLRIVTHPKVFAVPTPPPAALAFATEVRERPNRVDVRPRNRHWDIFTALCRAVSAKGNYVRHVPRGARHRVRQ